MNFFSVWGEMTKGLKLEFFMVCRGEGINVGVQGKTSLNLVLVMGALMFRYFS